MSVVSKSLLSLGHGIVESSRTPLHIWPNYIEHVQGDTPGCGESDVSPCNTFCEMCTVTDLKEPKNGRRENEDSKNPKTRARVVLLYHFLPLFPSIMSPTLTRSPVSSPLLGAPAISASKHVVSSSSAPSPKTVPPPPPPPPNAPKTAQLSQPHHRHPPAQPALTRRRTRPPTPSSSSAITVSDRIDYRAVIVIFGAGFSSL